MHGGWVNSERNLPNRKNQKRDRQTPVPRQTKTKWRKRMTMTMKMMTGGNSSRMSLSQRMARQNLDSGYTRWRFINLYIRFRPTEPCSREHGSLCCLGCRIREIQKRARRWLWGRLTSCIVECCRIWRDLFLLWIGLEVVLTLVRHCTTFFSPFRSHFAILQVDQLGCSRWMPCSCSWRIITCSLNFFPSVQIVFWTSAYLVTIHLFIPDFTLSSTGMFFTSNIVLDSSASLSFS